MEFKHTCNCGKKFMYAETGSNKQYDDDFKLIDNLIHFVNSCECMQTKKKKTEKIMEKKIKPFYVYNVRKILNEMNKGDISFSKMVELMNETSFNFNKENNKIEKPYPALIDINDIDNSNKELLTVWDRTRSVKYNGDELLMNTYSCSNCKETYHFEQVKHDFCPFCGTKYKYIIDVSI